MTRVSLQSVFEFASSNNRQQAAGKKSATRRNPRRTGWRWLATMGAMLLLVMLSGWPGTPLADAKLDSGRANLFASEQGSRQGGGGASESSLMPGPEMNHAASPAATAAGGRRQDAPQAPEARGDLDTTFNPEIVQPGDLRALAVQPDGKILLGGSFNQFNGGMRSNAARLNADGTLDTTFGNGLAGAHAEVETLAVQADGKLRNNQPKAPSEGENEYEKGKN